MKKRIPVTVSLDKRVQVYRDRSKQYRWRLRATNGKVVADSAEAYRRKRAALRGLAIVFELGVEVVAAAIRAQKKAPRRTQRRGR